MGQACPLPSRIPVPKGKTLDRMIALGIVVNLEDSDSGYVTYTLPSGWEMVDDSWRADLPNYFMVDASDMKFVQVNGSWKGTYDNCLTISIVTEPHKLIRRTAKPIPSETDGIAIIDKFANALTH
jgi:hypothetical protein